MRGEFHAVFRTPFGGPWRRFADPERVLSARGADSVKQVLAQVDAAVRDGMYAAGFVTYEAAGAFGLPVKGRHGTLPLASFGLFSPENVQTIYRFPADGRSDPGEWHPTISHDEYLAAVAAIKDRIAAGDTYQINFTFRLLSDFRGDPRQLMANLYSAQAGPWSGYIDIGTHAICSASPELFFIRNAEKIECHPMKGTAARGWWPAQDTARGDALRLSEKNRAENVMIVDMVRNDLGRVARTGSVTANPLFAVARYPLQWQMTSRVSADAADAALVDLFAAMFPSGSVTGAPKHSAMRIIQELESTPRGLYTGAIGYVSPHGGAHFNVAIRTVVVDRKKQQAEFGVGSGVVWDSVDRDEYDECLIKAAMLAGSRSLVPGSRFAIPGASGGVIPAYIIGETPGFEILETMRWAPGQGFALLDRHLERMAASAACFGFPCDTGDLRTVLQDAVLDLRRPAKVRLLLGHDGTVACEALDLTPLPDRPLRAALAPTPIDRANLFLFHKTTRREVYEAARASRPSAEAVILWNAEEEVTEATDFNVVAEIDGVKVTPPPECGLLPGVMREELLEREEILERRITLAELRAAPRIWLINSVRGWVECTLP